MSFVTRALALFIVLDALAAPAVVHAAVHTVSSGETLYAISRGYGITVNSLMQANNITDTLIHPGQKLYVPEEKPAAPQPVRLDVTAKSKAIGSNSRIYTVQAGDNFYDIGQKFSVNHERIMAANGLDSTIIYPGMTLYIPGVAMQPNTLDPSQPVPQSTPQPAPLQPATQTAAPQLTTTQSTAQPDELQPTQQVSRGFFQRPAPSDIDLLARLITAEADAEPYEGKVAVGAVVLNRVYGQGFPKTIQEVIYQTNGYEYQFQPVQNGLIDFPASDESVKAAKEALSGVDPTGGAVYFFANHSKNPWLWSRPVSKIIGNAIFAY